MEVAQQQTIEATHTKFCVEMDNRHTIPTFEERRVCRVLQSSVLLQADQTHNASRWENWLQTVCT
jgi:hypothetical protein